MVLSRMDTNSKQLFRLLGVQIRKSLECGTIKMGKNEMYQGAFSSISFAYFRCSYGILLLVFFVEEGWINFASFVPQKILKNYFVLLPVVVSTCSGFLANNRYEMES